MDALGIDHIIDKRRVKGPVSKVDLTKKDGQETIMGWISAGRVDAVMLAPPCGTASRAREIPIPKRHRLRKGMQPAPLRSRRAVSNGVAKFERRSQAQSPGCQTAYTHLQDGSLICAWQ